MKTAKISLNSIDKVKAFVNEISKFDCDFDLVSGRYVIDAKSIMGIFSLDLSKPIDLNIHADGAALDNVCLLYTSDAADDSLRVDLGGRRIIKKKFFQAEDGIRDRSPSRGLGDVYKRQVLRWCSTGFSKSRLTRCIRP